ncbi:MAG: DNA primase [Rubrobacteraceae bacterium]
MRISPQSIEQVRETANIVEVASEFTALRRQGTNYSGLCPYHEEKSPSFSVSPEKSFYYCFGCGVGGDAIKLIMDLKSLPFAEAVSHLAERFGVELKLEGRSPGEEKAAEQRTSRRRSAHKALAAATVYYHKYLLKSPAAEEARQYLKKRGLRDSTIEEFRLGYAPPRGRAGFVQAARAVGLGHEAVEAAGLLSPRGGDRFVDRVTFPISDRRGRMVGFGARSLGDAKPKYLNSPETEIFNKRSLLYGFPQVLEAMRREKAVLVVEGYTDVLMLYQSGIKNVVATLGTALTGQHLKTLSGYAERVYLLFDPDEAGENVLEKAFFPAAELRLDLRVVRLPQDPADWLLENSAGEFRELLSEASSVLEYVVRRTTDRVRGTGAVGRARALPKIKDMLQRIEDPVLSREALRLAAEALGMDPGTLREELREEPGAPNVANTSSFREAPRARPRRDQRVLSDPVVEAGREVLALVLARPDLAVRALREGMEAPASLNGSVVLETGDFGDETQGRIFDLLAEYAGEGSGSVYRAGLQKGLGPVLSDERARPLLDEISALRAAGERLYPSAAALRAAWFRLAAIKRSEAKLLTEDFDEKYRLHNEVKLLNAAAVAASNLTLDS